MFSMILVPMLKKAFFFVKNFCQLLEPPPPPMVRNFCLGGNFLEVQNRMKFRIWEFLEVKIELQNTHTGFTK